MKSIWFELKTNSVSFSQIDWADTTFRISYGRPLRPLISSIQTIGLNNLPILQEKENDQLRIVAGYRRLRALQKIKQEPVGCKIASVETQEKDLLLLNFHDNIDRGFNLVEKSMVLKRLSNFIAEGELVEGYLPLMNLPPKKEISHRYLNAVKISPIYLPFLLQGRLFPETIMMVLRDFFSLADLVLALFISLHWGFQKQKEFLLDLKEIAKRSLSDPEHFLFSSPVVELLQRTTGTPQQKGEALRKYFRSCLFPTLTKTEKAFEEAVSHLNLDQRTKIFPPPFFEGGQYGLEIKFLSSKQLKVSLVKVSQVIDEGKLDELP